MARASAFLRTTQTGFSHWCPGCKRMHDIQTHGTGENGPDWSFNSDLVHPTFGPSVRVTWGPTGKYKCCHYFLEAGQLKFCSDSTHEYAGKTVPLPTLPEHLDGQ